MALKLNIKEFIEKAKKKHGDYYDYSKVEYVNNQTKVCIICPEHGEFWQFPKEHLRGYGCLECSIIRRANIRKKNINDFIEQAREVHSNKYDYSKVEYVNAHTKVIVICPEHGEFKITPHNHLRGQGCKECAKLIMGSYQKVNTEEFIRKAKKIHGDKYDYSKVEYVNNRKKVIIICPEHGEFQQIARDHINGRRCPECGKKFNNSEKKVLEELKNKYNAVLYQYTPQWLYKKTCPQSLDFFLPEYNIGIEYQGRQHFSSLKTFGGENGFIKTQERDKRKYQKCVENNVKLFYISFEKKVPKDYIAPIYRTIEELFNAIDLYVEEK